MIFRQIAKVSFIVALLLFIIGCSNREPVNTLAETAPGPEMATATVLVATSTAVLPTPTVTTSPTITATVTEVLATQIPEAASTSQAEQVPAEAILYSDTVITNIDNGIAYDQNGVVAARQVEHNGEMVWIPAIVEQINARSHEAMNYALSDGSGRRVIASTYRFEQFELFDKPVEANVVFWDQARAEDAFADIFSLITEEGIQAQNLADPSRGPIMINPELMVTHPTTGEQVNALQLIKEHGTLHTHLIEVSDVPPGVAGLPQKGGLSYYYGPSDNLHFFSHAYDPDKPSEIHIFMYVQSGDAFTQESVDINGTTFFQAENSLSAKFQSSFFTLTLPHSKLQDQRTGFSYFTNNTAVKEAFFKLIRGTNWPMDTKDQAPAFWVDLNLNQ